MRAAFQVLVLPFRAAPGGGWEFAALRRADSGFWQFIAGGGEDAETPLQAARREASEEAGVPAEAPFHPLQTRSSIPVTAFPRHGDHWLEEGLYVVPEHVFAVNAEGLTLRLAAEHTHCRWGGADEIKALLHWDSNRNALWELTVRLARGTLTPAG